MKLHSGFWRITCVTSNYTHSISITVCSAYDYHYPHVACVRLSLTPPPLCRRLGGGLSQEPRGLLALRHALLLWKLHLGRHHAGKQPYRLFPTQQSHPAGLSRMVRKSVRGCWWFWEENVWRSHRRRERYISCSRLMHFVKVPKVLLLIKFIFLQWLPETHPLKICFFLPPDFSCKGKTSFERNSSDKS